jgi:hypothetical protein
MVPKPLLVFGVAGKLQRFYTVATSRTRPWRPQVVQELKQNYQSKRDGDGLAVNLRKENGGLAISRPKWMRVPLPHHRAMIRHVLSTAMSPLHSQKNCHRQHLPFQQPHEAEHWSRNSNHPGEIGFHLQRPSKQSRLEKPLGGLTFGLSNIQRLEMNLRSSSSQTQTGRRREQAISLRCFSCHQRSWRVQAAWFGECFSAPGRGSTSSATWTRSRSPKRRRLADHDPNGQAVELFTSCSSCTTCRWLLERRVRCKRVLLLGHVTPAIVRRCSANGEAFKIPPNRVL